MAKEIIEDQNEIKDEELTLEYPSPDVVQPNDAVPNGMFGGLAGLFGGLGGVSNDKSNSSSDEQPISYCIVKDNIEKTFDAYIIQSMIDMCYQDVEETKGCLADDLLRFFKVGDECNVDLLLELIEHFKTTITNEYNKKCGFNSIDRGVEIVMSITEKKLLYILDEVKKTIIDKTETK